MGLKKKHLLLLSALSGMLLSLAWPAVGNFAPLLFIGFVPLLIIEEYFYQHRKEYSPRKIFLYTYPGLVIWCGLTTWWIYCVTESVTTKVFTGSFVVLANAFLMYLVVYAFHWTRRVVGNKEGYISLVLYWLGFEYFHLDWDLSWPWLTLGNGFANYTELVQWYEYTGVFGGSLWVLLVNLMVFSIVKRKWIQGISWPALRGRLIGLALLVGVPIGISQVIYHTYEEPSRPINVVVVQPNIDPNLKFNPETALTDIAFMMELAMKEVDATTDYVVFPETALQEMRDVNIGNGWILRRYMLETNMEYTYSIQQMRALVTQFPRLNMVSGLSSELEFDADNAPPTAAKHENTGKYYDLYNAALQVNRNDSIQFYHKSKLVAGVELMPFESVLKPLGDLALDLGGTSGTLGVQDKRGVLTSSNGKFKVAPVICFESMFGEYVGGYLHEGANVIFILTNDGWWGDTPGYHQHMQYAKIRAVETRRSIARCANTGISCFINQLGEVSQPTAWWEPAVIKGTINANTTLTFYTKYGDYISRNAFFLGWLMIAYAFVRHFKNKRERLLEK